MVMPKWKLYLKIIVNFILFMLLLLFVFMVFPKILRFFMPFVIGWVISIIANPLVKFLEQKVKIVRKHSSAIIIIVVIVGVIGVLYTLIAIIVKESISLSNDIPKIYYEIQVKSDELFERLNNLYLIMPSFMQQFIDNIRENFQGSSQDTTLPNYLSFTGASTIAKSVAERVFQTIISILAAYFFIAERDNIVKNIKKVVPKTVSDYYGFIVSNFKTAVGGYFKAQFKIMIIMIGILFIGFEILRVDYSFLLAIGIAILDFLPFFGTGFVLWPWALVDFLLGNYFRAIGIVVIYILCQVIKQILQPKMVGDSVGISPLSTLIFMFIGYRFMGVLGMIIGIPIGMILTNLYRVGIFDRLIRGLKIIIHDLNEFRKF